MCIIPNYNFLKYSLAIVFNCVSSVVGIEPIRPRQHYVSLHHWIIALSFLFYFVLEDLELIEGLFCFIDLKEGLFIF